MAAAAAAADGCLQRLSRLVQFQCANVSVSVSGCFQLNAIEHKLPIDQVRWPHSFIHSFLYCNKCQNAFAVTCD